MEGAYSFADGGPIPHGDPQSQSYAANVSKPLQPATNDLSQKFKPRFEDGSEIKLEFMPSLARRADQDLLDYLQKRKISFHFLNDIDAFLKRHPELLKACPSWCYQLSALSPLQAYLFFIKGYLRPARYVDGALPAPEDEQIPVRPISLEHHSHDPELYEHITDIGQCLELLGRLDELVWLLTQAYHSGHRINDAQILLLTMATYAQPVDVLKYYEYCYLPSLQSGRYAPSCHRYRAVLTQVKTYSGTQQEPVREQPFGLKASGVEVMRSYRRVREAMARAADRGHDAIPVLVDCFAQAIQHRSIRRVTRDELNRMCEIAYELLEKEYLTRGGRDIVNLVMSMAIEARCKRGPTHFHPFVNNPTGMYFGIRSRHVRAAVNTVRQLYDEEVKEGYEPGFARELKKAEYRLAAVVGWFARADGSMNKTEYEFLRKKFPWRRFDSAAEYDMINPERLDVLLLLQSWI
ncbi:hypothetical protein E4T52_00007 [Aureobasidium sp. EXF-3400]|nr:hypothetical protein E4T52_00007 [Aureobasidium sp. EXF-3400]